MACDGDLYAPLIAALGGVATSTIVCEHSTLDGNVRQVLERAPPQFIVLGTSFGGRVALETALAAADRVKGLVVIGNGAKAVADSAAGLRREARMRGGEFEQVVLEMSEMVAHLPGLRGPATRQAFIDMAKIVGADVVANQAAAMAMRGDVSTRLAEIACPALMLWGREDQFSPAADGLSMSLATQHGRYAEIAECGHFPTLEAPEETAAILQHWLQDHFSLEA